MNNDFNNTNQTISMTNDVVETNNTIIQDYNRADNLSSNIGDNSEQPSQMISGNNGKKPISKVLIGIIISLIVIAAGCAFGYILFHKNLSSLNNNSNETSNKKGKKKDDGLVWDDYSIIIDGTEIKFPLKYSDFAPLGFHEMGTLFGDSTVLNDMVEPNSSGGSTYNSNIDRYFGLFTNDTTSNIALYIYNNSNQEKPVKDCYVTGMEFISTEGGYNRFTIGEVKIVDNTRKVEAIINKSTYEEVSSKFGPHYKYDYLNTLSYHPYPKGTSVVDIEDLSLERRLHFFFDTKTLILDSYDFSYYDIGSLK